MFACECNEQLLFAAEMVEYACKEIGLPARGPQRRHLNAGGDQETLQPAEVRREKFKRGDRYILRLRTLVASAGGSVLRHGSNR